MACHTVIIISDVPTYSKQLCRLFIINTYEVYQIEDVFILIVFVDTKLHITTTCLVEYPVLLEQNCYSL